MLKIGAFSALSRISVRMLRYYDENGLLRPSHIDRFTGYRYYDESQLAEACRIALLRDMGFGVASISAILHGGREAYRSALRQQRAELLRRRDEVTAQLILLEKALYRTEKEENPMEKYQVVCKTLPERYVASVRDILPDYFYEGRLWHTLMQETAGRSFRKGWKNCSFITTANTANTMSMWKSSLPYSRAHTPTRRTFSSRPSRRCLSPPRCIAAVIRPSTPRISRWPSGRSAAATNLPECCSASTMSARHRPAILMNLSPRCAIPSG